MTLTGLSGRLIQLIGHELPQKDKEKCYVFRSRFESWYPRSMERYLIERWRKAINRNTIERIRITSWHNPIDTEDNRKLQDRESRNSDRTIVYPEFVATNRYWSDIVRDYFVTEWRWNVVRYARKRNRKDMIESDKLVVFTCVLSQTEFNLSSKKWRSIRIHESAHVPCKISMTSSWKSTRSFKNDCRWTKSDVIYDYNFPRISVRESSESERWLLVLNIDLYDLSSSLIRDYTQWTSDISRDYDHVLS